MNTQEQKNKDQRQLADICKELDLPIKAATPERIDINPDDLECLTRDIHSYFEELLKTTMDAMEEVHKYTQYATEDLMEGSGDFVRWHPTIDLRDLIKAFKGGNNKDSELRDGFITQPRYRFSGVVKPVFSKVINAIGCHMETYNDNVGVSVGFRGNRRKDILEYMDLLGSDPIAKDPVNGVRGLPLPQHQEEHLKAYAAKCIVDFFEITQAYGVVSIPECYSVSQITEW